MEIIGYAAAVLIGISLGLIGGGGSILTVPVLVYLFGLEFLEGGFKAWEMNGKETDFINRISAEQFETEIKGNEEKIIDIRKESEYNAEHIHEAYSMPLAYINEWINELRAEEHFYMHCGSGYRSTMAASILQARGYRNFTEIEGGFKAIASTTSIPKSDFVCQTKILNKLD